ncbi:hypothetical protein EEB11_10980 [Pseudotabrizicola sediminis]|uniref:Uncharacterized protein n=1 Tax=Pseudotabrizicola sediminis TaxID=2486418 RepID=A0ABY2KLD2_9RHOB|nr:hypothetical protein EEB11_10980 [Pseudotabrizicola sediminis]
MPHSGQQVPVLEDLARAWATGDPLLQTTMAVAMVAIAGLAFVNVTLLIWNLGQMASFRKSPAYQKLRTTNGESQLTTLPLAIAMTLNVAFVLGLASMAQRGTNAEGVPSLTIIVRLMTALGILTLRVTHGMGEHFGAHAAPGDYVWILSGHLGVQIAFLLFGAAVLRAQGYFGRFVTGPEATAVSAR